MNKIEEKQSYIHTVGQERKKEIDLDRFSLIF